MPSKKTLTTLIHFYRTLTINQYIFMISKIPLIRKLLPAEPYRRSGKQVFPIIIRAFSVLFNFIVSLGFVLLLYLVLPNFIDDFYTKKEATLLVYFFLNIFLSTFIFSMINSTDLNTFFLTRSIHMSTKDALLGHHLIKLFNLFIKHLLVSIILILLHDLPTWALILPFYVLSINVLSQCLGLFLYPVLRKLKWVILIHSLMPAIIFGFAGFMIFFQLPVHFLFFIFPILLSPLGFLYLTKTSRYEMLRQDRLNLKKLEEYQARQDTGIFIQFKTTSKSMDAALPASIAKKHGISYLHAVFFERYRSELTKHSMLISQISALILLGAFFVIFFFEDSLAAIGFNLHDVMLRSPVLLLLLLYFLSPGKKFTRLLFFQMDRFFLQHPFYRKQSTVLNALRIRFIKLVQLSLLQILPLLLFILFSSLFITKDLLLMRQLLLLCLTSSLWISLHELFVYYLFEPYTLDLKIKSIPSRISNIFIYLLCWLPSVLNIDVLSNLSIILIGMFLYMIIGTALTYHLAPKTFRLK